MGETVVAMVPLRGGSKGIPGKNTRPMAGKPLCQWVLEAASLAFFIDHIYVSTDCDQIAKVVSNMGLPVQVLKRPSHLAEDDSTTESVMLHFIEQVPCDVLFTIQATSPCTKATDLLGAWDKFNRWGYDSMLTGVRTQRFFWTPHGKPINYDPANRPRRQQFQGYVMENGAFYITKVPILKETGCRLGGKIGVYEMQVETATEIDEWEDWEIVEKILEKRNVFA